MQRPSNVNDHPPASSLELAIEHAVDALDRSLSALRIELRLSPIECSMVRLLARKDWTIGALARAGGVGRSSVSMAARRLEERGFVTCARVGGRTELTLAPHVRRDFLDAYHAPLRAAIASWSLDRPQAMSDATRDLAISIAEHADDLREHRSRRDVVDQLADAMVRGDHAVCFELTRPFVEQGAPGPAYETLLDAMHTIAGQREVDELDMLDEQVAAGAARRTVDRLHGLTCHARTTTRTALVGALRGQSDELHHRMVMNELERTGWDVLTIPRTASPDDLAQLHRRARPDTVVFTIAHDYDRLHAAALVAAVQDQRPVIVGARGTSATQLATLGKAARSHVIASVGTIAELALPVVTLRSAGMR